MDMSKASLVLAGALCLGVGAGGAYLGTRSTAPEPEDVVGVEGSEAIVTEAPVANAPAPVAVAEPTIPQGTPPQRTAPASRTPSATSSSVRRQPARPTPVPRNVVAPAAEGTATPNVTLSPPALGPVGPAPEALPPPEPIVPAAPRFVDLEIPTDSVLGLQVESSISSERARVEDQVMARVTRDVRVGDRIAIPAGSRAEGEVTLVERGGRLKERARLGVRFTSVVLADGTRVPIATETIFREGDAPSAESAAKIGGGAIGGAIIGGILGGAKGAIIGGSAGAGAGTAAVLAGGRNAATLASGTPVTVRITEPAVVSVANNE